AGSTSAEPINMRRVAPARRYCAIHVRNVLPPAPARNRKPKPFTTSSKKMASFLPASVSAATVLESSFMMESPCRAGETLGKQEAASPWHLLTPLPSENGLRSSGKQGLWHFPA